MDRFYSLLGYHAVPLGIWGVIVLGIVPWLAGDQFWPAMEGGAAFLGFHIVFYAVIAISSRSAQA